ncbi:MAG: L-threonylcarbamoyladenylate synthase [Micrococcales bacterium]|nr:L-threonylcarbamoyladenylate synthase [Micrococcales bacterium]
MSSVIDCTDAGDIEETVRFAASAVRRGELIVLPTDTVYGVGANAFDAAAVRALLAAKGRGRDTPIAVLVPDPRTVDGLAVDVPAYARRLIEEFWPGPLTLVLRAQTSLLWDLGDTNGTVGLRMPDQEVALALLAQTGPMAVTSANKHGQPAATTVEEAREQLGKDVAIYLDGGPCDGQPPSTILDCTKDEPVVLRRGGLRDEDIFAALGAGTEGSQESDSASVDPHRPPVG